MADKRKEEEFTVADRRRFSFEDGEVHDNPDRATEPVKEEVAAAPPAEETKKRRSVNSRSARMLPRICPRKRRKLRSNRR